MPISRDYEVSGNQTGLLNANTETGRQHRKAKRTGQYVFGGSAVFLVVALIAALGASPGLAFAAAGLGVALGIVGMLLVFESERQRRRDPRRRPPVCEE